MALNFKSFQTYSFRYFDQRAVISSLLLILPNAILRGCMYGMLNAASGEYGY